MITVEEAQALCLSGLEPLSQEVIPLTEAAGRVLSASVRASRAQPPFAASAMDGYAIAASAIRPGAQFTVVGEAPAGHAWPGRLQSGQALRIFTGAPVPEGADAVVIQEDVTRQGDTITLGDHLGTGLNIRPEGADFKSDFQLEAPQRLGPAHLALLAAMNVGDVPVSRRPSVAIIATGDELVMPGGHPRPDQIIASNLFALKAMLEAEGAIARLLPIAVDTAPALEQAFDLAASADLVVTIGGASVGDHDLVGSTAAGRGLDLAFHKIAMRPGKPLMAGRFGATPFLGLPGNPVSAIVCGHLFLLPMVRRMMGLNDVLPPVLTARLTDALGPNGPRAHYMLARMTEGPTGREVTPFDRQDSSLLTVLSEANCLMIRPIQDRAREAGEPVQVLPT